MRYYLWAGSPAALQELRAAELRRKTAQKIPFTPQSVFQGTLCAATSSKSEYLVWSVIAKSVEARMRSYPVGLEDTKKTLDADASPEGPHLSPSAKSAQDYLLAEQVTLVNLMRLSMVM